MESLIPFINEWFLNKSEYLLTFAQKDSRLEGWFKGELFVLFEKLSAMGIIDKFEREVKIHSMIDDRRKQIDFILHIGGQQNLCEIKALCISQSAGTPRDLNFYFRDDHVGLIKDFKKLEEFNNPYKWVLAFIYPAPDPNDWCMAIHSLPITLKQWKTVTSPIGASQLLFIALFKSLYIES